LPARAREDVVPRREFDDFGNPRNTLKILVSNVAKELDAAENLCNVRWHPNRAKPQNRPNGASTIFATKKHIACVREWSECKTRTMSASKRF